MGLIKLVNWVSRSWIDLQFMLQVEAGSMKNHIVSGCGIDKSHSVVEAGLMYL